MAEQMRIVKLGVSAALLLMHTGVSRAAIESVIIRIGAGAAASYVNYRPNAAAYLNPGQRDAIISDGMSAVQSLRFGADIRAFKRFDASINYERHSLLKSITVGFSLPADEYDIGIGWRPFDWYHQLRFATGISINRYYPGGTSAPVVVRPFAETGVYLRLPYNLFLVWNLKVILIPVEFSPNNLDLETIVLGGRLSISVGYRFAL